jgi:hypothetical protein
VQSRFSKLPHIAAGEKDEHESNQGLPNVFASNILPGVLVL